MKLYATVVSYGESRLQQPLYWFEGDKCWRYPWESPQNEALRKALSTVKVKAASVVQYIGNPDKQNAAIVSGTLTAEQTKLFDPTSAEFHKECRRAWGISSKANNQVKAGATPAPRKLKTIEQVKVEGIKVEVITPSDLTD